MKLLFMEIGMNRQGQKVFVGKEKQIMILLILILPGQVIPLQLKDKKQKKMELL